MGKKFKMPSVKEFLRSKTIGGTKVEPVWVYLEREMKANEDKKPYNTVVGEWLKFMKDLKAHYHAEHQRQKEVVKKEIGPTWYYELSHAQLNVLKKMKQDIHQDLIEGLPKRTMKDLRELGINLKIPKETLLKSMEKSYEDTGLFVWSLYTEIFKLTPIDNRKEYDMNSGLLMSALAAIDMEETIQRLEELTKPKQPPKAPEVVKKKKPPPRPPAETMDTKTIYFTKNKEIKPPPPKPKPSGIRPFDYKIRVRSADSLERIRKNKGFVAKRIERNIQEQTPERVGNFKFWTAPAALRSKDPMAAEYAKKEKMLKKKPKFHHKTATDNMQFAVAGISFAKGRPFFVLNSVYTIPTGYIPINAGLVKVNDDYITHIAGYWEFPKNEVDKCSDDCDCIEKYEKKVHEYLHESKCKCGHRYDFYHTGKPTEIYMRPPTRNSPLSLDMAKVYSMDPMEDFILNAIEGAMISEEASSVSTEGVISARGVPLKGLLGALLTDLAETTPLILPHLPQADKISHLLEWLRIRIKGKKMSEKQLKKQHNQIVRRWDAIERVKFTANAARIPFTSEQLENMDWNFKSQIMQIAKGMLEDFVARNQEKQVQHARLLFPTMKNLDKNFLKIYYTYFPSRLKDTYLLGLYDPSIQPDHPARTCPLNF